MQEIKVTKTCDACGKTLTGTPSEMATDTDIRTRVARVDGNTWTSDLCQKCYEDYLFIMLTANNKFNFKGKVEHDE